MKIKFGAIVVDGRGKVGGHVASKNRAGAYLRTKVTPVNPQTSYQTAVRATLTTLSQLWRTLTEDQRAAWNTAVENFKGTNVFGDLKTPSGLNLYLRLNATIALTGQAFITSPPPLATTPENIDFSIVADESASTVAVTFTPAPVPAAIYYVLEATPQVSPGKNFLKNLFRQLPLIAPAATSPQAAGASYEARFGNLVAGQKIGFRMFAIDSNTGLRSGVTSLTTIVIA